MPGTDPGGRLSTDMGTGLLLNEAHRSTEPVRSNTCCGDTQARKSGSAGCRREDQGGSGGREVKSCRPCGPCEDLSTGLGRHGWWSGNWVLNTVQEGEQKETLGRVSLWRVGREGSSEEVTL